MTTIKRIDKKTISYFKYLKAVPKCFKKKKKKIFTCSLSSAGILAVMVLNHSGHSDMNYLRQLKYDPGSSNSQIKDNNNLASSYMTNRFVRSESTNIYRLV